MLNFNIGLLIIMVILIVIPVCILKILGYTDNNVWDFLYGAVTMIQRLLAWVLTLVMEVGIIKIIAGYVMVTAVIALSALI